MTTSGRLLRDMRPDDVAAVMAVQEPASIAGLSVVFPQDRYPFPREVLAERWRSEIAEPGIECYVVLREDRVAGFAATRGSEVMHFGIAVDEWGSGLAVAAHDELVRRLRAAGAERPWLCVYAANPRGRAFWEKLGWVHTGERRRGPLPPHAELLTYALDDVAARNRDARR
ncbi:GNAT family N-acetyltransferase [Nocardioides sp. J2M5]|uniref:GNAT family N-acetyltransferase n=1 Tax=Nocardioides palaemonis TaxID=2829810 RepID=UPI001BA5F33D|nr:GNAT family N-acetyltransferase [Nocardioides palaemonis]MBS2939038.1 GNAT family N-acetyltransferase [Nocardioides palaemonis]